MVASASDLLQTKLAIPPARTELISRPRLIEQFNDALSHPLTLICAPAGFGKTTLLSECFSSETGLSTAVAWLSLDTDDNDPGRFLTYLVYALAGIGDIDSEGLLFLLQSSQPPPKVILTALLSRLEAFPGRFVLVLDDYHLITTPLIHEGLVFLFEHLPAQMHLILTSREDPSLPLSRLRGQGQLAEIRADSLRFTLEEAAQFLHRVLGIHLSQEQVAELGARTEGWIAGLQLAALAMKGRDDLNAFIAAFTGSHRYILDYLTEEVLSRQPENIQNFLLQTSILNRLCGPLCDVVTGRNNGSVLLEQIDRGNLFLIMLDDEGFWYRYHHLFGDMLYRHLQHSNPAIVAKLHQQASLWFEENGWITEAIEHAFSANDEERAARLVARHGFQVWSRGEATTFLHWLERLPANTFKDYPKLGLNYALLLSITDDFVGAEAQLTLVEKALSGQAHIADPAQYAMLMGQAGAIRTTVSLMLEQPWQVIVDAGQQALAHLAEDDLQWRGWITELLGCAYYAVKGDMAEGERCLEDALAQSTQVNDVFNIMMTLTHTCRMYMIQGRLREATATAERHLQFADDPGWQGRPAAGLALLDRSRVRYEQNDLGGALRDILAAHDNIEGHLLKRASVDGDLMLAIVKQALGQKAEARQLLQQAVETIRQHELKQTFIPVAAWQQRFWLQEGDIASATAWAKQVEMSASEDWSGIVEYEYLSLARVFLAQGQLEKAAAFLDRLFAVANDNGRFGRVIEICILQALVASSQADTERAIDKLAYALSIAEPEGYVRTFIDEGAPMVALLREALAQSISAAYVTKLLAAFDDQGPMQRISHSAQLISDDIEPLSERELEVLRLIADGASNREIAEALVVSVGTVKKHLNSIFLSLDVHSRTQAVAIARNHDLL